jgi:hypothetical protein
MPPKRRPKKTFPWIHRHFDLPGDPENGYLDYISVDAFLEGKVSPEQIFQYLDEMSPEELTMFKRSGPDEKRKRAHLCAKAAATPELTPGEYDTATKLETKTRTMPLSAEATEFVPSALRDIMEGAEPAAATRKRKHKKRRKSKKRKSKKKKRKTKRKK